MKKALYAIVGLVVGGLIGFVVVTGIAYLVFSMTQPPSEWTPVASKGYGLIFGIPIGAIVFCVIGLLLGRKKALQDTSYPKK